MPKQTCTPSNVFSPVEHQTLFLGMSVKDFSCNLGWNFDESSVDITLVKDECASPAGTYKVYYDPTSSSPEKQWTAADPGFSIYGLTQDQPPPVGAPAYFRFGDFEYCGLISSWTKHDSSAGKDIYTVRLTDPREILNGTQIIVGNYAGSVNDGAGANVGPYNVFNVYGFEERFRGNPCPSYPPPSEVADSADGVTFGSVAQAFGGADITENGMSWTLIKEGINILTSGIPYANTFVPDFSPYGRIVYRGGLPNARFGLLPFDGNNANFDTYFGTGYLTYLAEYYLDLSDMPAMPSDYRISGTSVSLMDIISQVCQDAACDFYIEIVPVRDAGSIRKFIKVRTVSRALQPSIGAIEAFIDSLDTPVESSVGRELRNEVHTKVLIGGNKKIIWQAFQDTNPLLRFPDGSLQDPSAPCLPGTTELEDDIISPYWGLDGNNNAIKTAVDANGNWEIEVDPAGLNNTLSTLSIVSASVTINELELKQALVSFDEWLDYSFNNSTDISTNINIEGIFRPGVLATFITDAANWAGRDAIKANRAAHISESTWKDIQKIYNWVYTFASEYYGHKFMVRIPYNCVFLNSDGVVRQIMSPSDGGWTEETTVLGLSHPSVFTTFFENEDGTLGAFARYDNYDELDLTDAPSDSYVYSTATNQIWVKVTVDPEFVYTSQSTYCSPRAVITIPPFIKRKFGVHRDGTGTTTDQRYAASIVEQLSISSGTAAATEVKTKTENDAESELLNAGVELHAGIPAAAAIPLYNHVNTYGPWITSNTPKTGPPGQTFIEKDDGLVPWNYGSYLVLNTAAQNLADEGISKMQVGELGNFTFAGMPDIPLGAELRSLSSGFFTGGSNNIENRSPSITAYTLTDSWDGSSHAGTTYNINLGQWVGTYGPSVTNINVKMGEDGVRTNYVLRTYTAKSGILNKLNADRIRKNGLFQRQQNKQLQLIEFVKRHKQAQIANEKTAKQIFNKVRANDAAQANKNTPHSVLIGDLREWDKVAGAGDEDWRRTIVASKSMFDIINNLNDTDYANYAMMSWDGLIRPVSMDGSGGLPQYFNKPTAPCTKSNTQGAMPPVTDPSDGATLYNLLIDIDYLNPFSNPSSSRNLINDYQDGDNVGHDVDIVGRGGAAEMTGEGSHISMHTHLDGYNSADRSHYQDDYRFLALRGPLIMTGWGYDLDGKPIPNAADTEENAAAGTFTESSLQDKFLPEFLRKPHTWVTAPVDLRLDRQRGVWVAPPTHRVVKATLLGSLNAFGSTTAYLHEGPDIYDADGNAISYASPSSAPRITVRDEVGTSLPLNTKVLAYYDPQTCEYYVIESPPSGESSTLCITNIECGDSNYEPLTTGTCTTVERLVGATGIQITNYENLGIISHDIKITNNSSISICSDGIETVTNDTHWDTLRFAKNIYAIKETGAGPTCTMNIAVGLDVQDTDTCYDPNLNQLSMTADALYFAEGLAVSNDEDENCGAANIHLAITATNSLGSPVSTRISRFQAGNNVTFSELSSGDCRILEINSTASSTGVLSIANSGCGAALGGSTEISTLVGGVGIEARVDANGIGVLDHDLTIGNTSTSACNQTDFSGREWETINFAKGLKAFEGTECTAEVGLFLDITESTDCYNQSNNPGTANADSLVIAKGLKFNTPAGAACGAASIHLAMDVGNVSNVAEIDLDCGLSASDKGNCTVGLKSFVNVSTESGSGFTPASYISFPGCLEINSYSVGNCDAVDLEFPQDDATIVTVLTGVRCVDGDIVGDTLDLVFSSCGTLVRVE